MYYNLILEPLGTLVHYNPRDYLMHYFMNAKTEKLVYDITFGSNEWHATELGEMPRWQADRIMLEKGAAQKCLFEVRTALEDWPDALHPSERMVHHLRQLKRGGAKIYYLSRMPADMKEKLELQGFWKLFDGGLTSSELHASMPDPAVLSTLMKKYNLSDMDTFFVDPNSDSVKVAGRMNIASFQYKDPSHFWHTFKGLLGN